MPGRQTVSETFKATPIIVVLKKYFVIRFICGTVAADIKKQRRGSVPRKFFDIAPIAPTNLARMTSSINAAKIRTADVVADMAPLTIGQ